MMRWLFFMRELRLPIFGFGFLLFFWLVLGFFILEERRRSFLR